MSRYPGRVLLHQGMGAGLGEEVRLCGMRAGECVINYYYDRGFGQTGPTWDGGSVGRWKLPVFWSEMSIDFGVQQT